MSFDPFYLFLAFLFFAAVVVLFFIKNFHNRANFPSAERGSEDFVSRDLHEATQRQLEAAKQSLAEKEREIRELGAQIAAKDQQLLQSEQSLRAGREQTEALSKQMRMEFENIASKLLEEKGRAMSDHNHRAIQGLLLPLRERITEFESGIEQKFLEETRDKAGLKKEIEQLVHLNQQLSRDANNLTTALKGSAKTQGDWGEFQLELLLEKSGLTKGLHFEPQSSFRDDAGQLKRPDFIVHLPEDRQLIIDSKVSLTAFARFYSDDDPTQRAKHLRDHVDSVRRHVLALGSKEYHLLPGLHAPDYMLLFVPIEGALTAAVQADPKLFTDALENNVVLVSTGSLITTMRTVAHIWKQEKQARSVTEIAKQSGLLYDKFVAFVEDLRTIGTRLDSAKSAYDDALNKLVNSTRYGDTLVGRAEKIRALGARSSKQLPKEFAAWSEEETE